MHYVHVFRTRSRELYRETRGSSPRSGESRRTFEQRDVCFFTVCSIQLMCRLYAIGDGIL